MPGIPQTTGTDRCHQLQIQMQPKKYDLKDKEEKQSKESAADDSKERTGTERKERNESKK